MGQSVGQKSLTKTSVLQNIQPAERIDIKLSVLKN